MRALWITPPEGSLDEVVAGASEGVPILLRRPGFSTRALLAEARVLRKLARVLLIHRRLDIALAIGADGVHLPERGVSVGDAKAILGKRIVGASRHDREGLEQAAAEGADYATLSPFATVPGKGPALGADGFKAQRKGVDLPVLALGGIDRERAAMALAAGADGVAFLRAGLDPEARRKLVSFVREDAPDDSFFPEG
ncbi:MAG: thiamine phosphate synthase [Myxococcota bacterium]